MNHNLLNYIGVEFQNIWKDWQSIFVGTPGLGYPLLLCLGKGLVVILNYIQTAGPLRSGILFSQQRSGPVPRLGKVRGHHVSRKRQELVREQPGLRTSQGDRTPAGSRTPHGVPNPLYSNRTPHQGKKSTPRVGVVWRRHVSARYGRLDFHTNVHPPLHSLR